MRKIYIKLIAMLLALILSVAVVIMSSYAWLVLAGNPAVTGIQVAIGGGNTILMAPNIQETGLDGIVYNIPGQFSDKLNFGQQEAYAYLQTVGNLTPVSTSNGVDWFIPTYYSGNDAEVQSGRIQSGMMRDISEFIIDSSLSYANLDPDNATDAEKIREGSYIYLDFWVVSPGGDYKLRISTGSGTADGGSFVVDLMEPEESEGGYVLVNPYGSAASAVRIGFLANDLILTDNSMLTYTGSRYFDERFTALRGMYQEPETGTVSSDANRFTIYEPNGDYHPFDYDLDGCYKVTKPLGLIQNQIVEQTVQNSVTVQRKSTWVEAGAGTLIEQYFQTALYSWPGQTFTESELSNKFYSNTLQGQISPYVNKGQFFTKTGRLYAEAAKGFVTAAEMEDIPQSGATEDIYIIQLERNVPQRIRMFIWLEGQDMDCVDGVNSARFAVNIEFAGGDA